MCGWASNRTRNNVVPLLGIPPMKMRGESRLKTWSAFSALSSTLFISKLSKAVWRECYKRERNN